MFADLKRNGKYEKIGNYELEEYSYQNGRITEKRVTDNGYDQCFGICWGKYILKYKYVK